MSFLCFCLPPAPRRLSVSSSTVPLCPLTPHNCTHYYCYGMSPPSSPFSDTSSRFSVHSSLARAFTRLRTRGVNNYD
ncbi:hypothetical protein DIRU0_C19900 [Diutina rugosa]